MDFREGVAIGEEKIIENDKRYLLQHERYLAPTCAAN
jgi:hypothetical protein